MEKVLIFFISFLFIFSGPLCAASKQELADLQRKAKEKEEELKKYRQQENLIAKEIQNLTKKEQQTEKLSIKLVGDIEVIQSQRSKTIEHKTLLEENLPMWQSVVRGELSGYVIQNALKSKYYDSEEEKNLAIFSSALQNHLMFVQKLKSETKETSQKIESFKEKSKELEAKKEKLETQKEVIKDTYKKKQEDLENTHRRNEQLQNEIKELKASAEQLEKILKEAERQRAAAAKKAGTKVSAATLNINKNSLPWPVSGKIISKFGKEYQHELKTWIFRDGIKISARVNEPVLGVDEGTVIFAGEFRSYGNVVILDHKGGFFTIYGFLSEIRVRRTQLLHKGQILGTAGKDTQGSGMGSGADAVYFEIRVGTTAIDPEDWLTAK